MPNENKDLKKKATVVGAIALSAVLAGGIGYTSYNLLNDKANEETIVEEVKSSDNEEVVATHAKVIALEVIDEPDDLVATAVEFEEPGLILFDEQDDYSDLENAIANAEKQQENYRLFEDEVDEFQELNDSLVAVATEGKVMVKENDIATIETFPIESAEIEEAEVPIKVDEPRKPVLFIDMVAIAKPSEPIVQTRPSQPVKPSEPISRGALIPTEPPVKIPINPGPIISYESKITETAEPTYSEIGTPNDSDTLDIQSELVEPGGAEVGGNPTSSVNQVATEEPVEEEKPLDPLGPNVTVEQIPIDPTSPEEQVEQEIPVDPLSTEETEQENLKEPYNPDDSVTAEETSSTDSSETEIPSEPVDPVSPTEPDEPMNPETPEELIESEIPTAPTIPVDHGEMIEPVLPSEPSEPEEISDPETISAEDVN